MRKGFFGGISHVEIPLGKQKRYNVKLVIQPTEEERAIILKYKLDELAAETEEKFSEEFLAEHEAHMRVTMGNISEEMFKKIVLDGIADMRKEKKQTLIGQYFDNPYTKNFDIRQDAHTYADKLEKEILPLIKNQIDYYRLDAVRGGKRTISL